MGNIDLTRFVDINIKHHSKSEVVSIRDTAVLLSTETLLESVTDNIFSSLEEWEEFVNDNELNVSSSGGAYRTDAYLRVFFANGGNKVRVISQVTDNKAAIKVELSKLPNEQIVVASTGEETVLREVAEELSSSDKPLSYKLLISKLGYTSENIPELSTIPSRYFIKLSNTLGSEMTFAAYLSNIDIYGINTVQDYAFTKENGYYDHEGNKVEIVEPQDDEVLGAALDRHFNIIMNVAQADRNLGGDLVDGKDATNEFILIVLQQTLTDRLMNLLAEKIKNSSGLASIYSIMDQELAKYLRNGYLTTDKIWSDNDLNITYNGKSYNIISKGDALQLGYKIKILPYISLTDEDKAQRKTPPIYVILSDSYGIRKIKITGEII